MIEFAESESHIFEEVAAMLKTYPTFEKLRLVDETVLSIPGFMIHLERRKVYCEGREIILTAKEYDILCLLMENRGRVLTYSQIYQNVWGGETLGSESNIQKLESDATAIMDGFTVSENDVADWLSGLGY